MKFVENIDCYVIFAKLLLNSSYGKLAERVVRDITVREVNQETGAIHLVGSGEQEID